MVQSSSSLLCCSNPLASAAKPLDSRRLLIRFKASPSTSKRSYSTFQLRFDNLLANGLRLSPLCCSATEEVVETSNGESEFIEIGYISDVHGLQGEIRVKHNTDFPDLRFERLGKRWLRQQFSGREKVLEVELVAGRGHPGDKSWIVKLSGFDTVDQAKQLVGATFLVRESDRPELEEGEFYSRDLVSMSVILKDTGEQVGTVVDVFNNGGNDLLHVKLDSFNDSPSGSGKQKSEISEPCRLVWIPFVEAIVPDVDLDRRELHITPPKGLLELNLRSEERSKKERRLLEWKERKKLQRRLIAAKKILCELDQQHIFHGFRYGEKSQRSLLAEQIVSVNSNLLQQALQATEMPINGSYVTGSMHDATIWKSGHSLKISKKHLTGMSKYREAGLQLITEGKVAAVLVLNTGKPGSSSEPNHVDGQSSTISLMESLLLDQLRFIKEEQRAHVPLILMSPAHEIQPLEKLFARHNYFNFNSEKVRFLEEEKLPVVSCSAVEQKKNQVLMKSPWIILQSPIGSGGIISAISSYNILEDLIASGVEYIEVCSINERCLCGNPVFLGFVGSCQTDIGIMIFQDEKDFEDNLHIVLPMKSMKKLVKQVNELHFHALMKSNSHVELVNKEWIDVIPSIPNSYEFHSSIVSLLSACSLDKACIMEVIQ